MQHAFRYRLTNAVRTRLNLPAPLVSATLLGRTYKVRGDEVIRTSVDYDDAWLLACAAHASAVFDVGANVGQSAFLILSADRRRRIVLVEANPAALAQAAENLILNRLSDRASFICSFAGATSDSQVQFWTVGTGAAGSAIEGHSPTARRIAKPVLVPTITLDDLADAQALQPDLIKVDVEGAEIDVLRGSRRIAAAGTARYLVEMHAPPSLPMRRNAELVLEWCGEVGYRAWYLAEAVALDSAEQVASRGRCHLLLQPRDWPYPEWLAGIEQGAPLERVRLS